MPGGERCPRKPRCSMESVENDPNLLRIIHYRMPSSLPHGKLYIMLYFSGSTFLVTFTHSFYTSDRVDTVTSLLSALLCPAGTGCMNFTHYFLLSKHYTRFIQNAFFGSHHLGCAFLSLLQRQWSPGYILALRSHRPWCRS